MLAVSLKQNKYLLLASLSHSFYVVAILELVGQGRFCYQKESFKDLFYFSTVIMTIINFARPIILQTLHSIFRSKVIFFCAYLCLQQE